MTFQSRKRLALVWLVVLIIAAATGSSSFLTKASTTEQEFKSCSSNDKLSVDSSPELAWAEATIQDFLERNASPQKRYRVQGWRWHTMSLVRDLRRLVNLTSQQMQNSTALDHGCLERATYHVIDFNMRALHRIEEDIFFPWLRAKLTVSGEPGLATAFGTLLDQVIAGQREVSQLGTAVKQQTDIISNPVSSQSQRLEAINRAATLTTDLLIRVRAILEREDSFLVPAVAILVSDAEQRAFNNKVILKLGIFDSRLHLVGMYDAVQEQSEREQLLFQEEIPSIPRMLIPRWRRLLYNPQAGILDEPQCTIGWP